MLEKALKILPNYTTFTGQKHSLNVNVQKPVLSLKAQYVKTICNIRGLVSLCQRHLHYRLHLAWGLLC